jgi:cytidine deaminase
MPDADLLAAAEAARANAYAPYSKFQVGAAVRAASGAIFAGANVENAAYPVGTCAEAGAIAAMIAAGERVIVEVLVTGPGPDAITPCGACRQRIREFAAPDTKIHAAGPDGITMSFTLAALLPEAFGPAHLGQGRDAP